MYEIKVLSSKEFDEVAKSDPRYSHVDDTNLGFADVKHNRVFVKDTGVHELNAYLIKHEIDHLVEEHATDEDSNGIRHKKFFKELFLPSITGGIISGGQTGGLFNLGREENKFDLFGPLGSKGEKTTVSGGMEGLSNNPFGNFSVGSGTVSGGASPSVSQTVTGGVQSGGLQPGISGLNNQGSGELSPELLQKLKGNYAGRQVF